MIKKRIVSKLVGCLFLLYLPISTVQAVHVQNDFNGDGKSDIFWRYDVTNVNKIYLMSGNSIIADTNFTHLTNSAWTVVGSSDFDKDGKSDILWRDTFSGANQIALTNGRPISRTVDLSIPGLSAASWKVAGIGDFDGDGNDDIFWHNDNGQNHITFMNGTAQRASATVTAITDVRWKVAGIADFNQDGKDDVLWRNDATKRVWLYLMNGNVISNGGGAGQHVVYTAANWNIDGVGDFNGDGKADILWRNSNNGRVWMFHDVNDIVSQFAARGTEPLVPGEHVAFTGLIWEIKSVGDYNGDGKSDVLWRHSTYGWNHMYLMDGAIPAQQVDVNSLPDLNWKVQK